jgi:hypothetical protein
VGKASLRVKDNGLRRMVELGKSLAGRPHVKVGFLEETAQRRPVEGEPSDLSNVELAIILHYGTAHLPARKFLAKAMSGKRRAWRLLLGKIGREYLKGGSLSFGLAVLGGKAIDQVRTAIRTIGIPDAARTLAEKRGTRPLIDSKQLLEAVTSRVET